MMAFPKRKNIGKRIKPKNPKVTEAEDRIQEKAEAYLENMDFRYIHIPNMIWGFIHKLFPVWLISLASRYLAGIPDLVVFHPNGRYLLLELKTEIGDLNQAQRRWRKGLNVQVSHCWTEAEKILKEFCENP